MPQYEVILSVMVISHNQVHLIGRCLESILAQKIDVAWEIVISDDASTDGTWEWIQKFARLKHEPEIIISRINSSDFQPTVTSDRCAANKANVYSLARGKYCVNIDADDYLVGETIYQHQIDQLEAHPDCAVAMQNIWILKDGQPFENGVPWHCPGTISEGDIISHKVFCKKRLLTSNPAFMMRRDPSLNPMEKYGLLFDDPVISMHHFFRGNIITSDAIEYVYVQYKNSIWNSVLKNSDDTIARDLSNMAIILKFFPTFYRELINLEGAAYIQTLKQLINHKQRLILSYETKNYVNRLQNKNLLMIIQQTILGSFICRIELFCLLFKGKFNIESKLLDYLFFRLVLS